MVRERPLPGVAATVSRIAVDPATVAALALWLVVQVAVWRSLREGGIPISPDGLDFIRVSRAPLLSVDFWGDTRAPVLPLLLRIVRWDLEAMRWVQLLLAGLAWGALAVAVASTMRTRVGRGVVYVMITLLTATTQVSLWHGLVLAESLSMTLMVALLAVGVVLPRTWSWPRIAAAAVLGAGFLLVRDSNALLGLVVAAVIVGAILLRRAPLRAGAVAVVFAVAAFLGMASSSSGERWLQGMHHAVRDRVLQEPSGRAWFEDRGMPDAELVLSAAGNDYVRGPSFFSDPRFADYLDWLRHDGRRALATYLLTHPFFAQDGEKVAFSALAGPLPSISGYAGLARTDAPVGTWFDDWVWPEQAAVVLPWLAAAAVGSCGVVLLDRRRAAAALVVLAGITIGFGLSVVIANLDTAETPRHVVVPNALARISALAGVVIVAETVTAHVARSMSATSWTPRGA